MSEKCTEQDLQPEFLNRVDELAEWILNHEAQEDAEITLEVRDAGSYLDGWSRLPFQDR